MKQIATRGRERAFALPTVLIASVVMMMVLLSGLVASSSVNVSLREQYNSKLADQAVEAGAVYLRACAEKMGTTINWTSQDPIGGCVEPTAGTTCSTDSTADSNCFIVNTTNVKSTFRISAKTTDSSGTMSFTIDGIVRQYRSSVTTPVSTLTSSARVSIADSKSYLVPSMQSGNFHECMVMSSNQVFCWGNGGGYRLGNNSTANTSTPVQVQTNNMPAGVGFKMVAAGNAHTCGIGTDDQAYCWGTGSSGQLGAGSGTTSATRPIAITRPSSVTGFKSITASNSNTCAISSDDQAYCWGGGLNSELGNGSSSYDSFVPLQVLKVNGNTGYKEVTAGFDHVCALGLDGEAYCWGLNSTYQLGTGSTSPASSSTPVLVASTNRPAGVKYKSINAGYNHNCTIGTDNQAYCWGAGINGQLGSGASNRSSPFPVSAGLKPAGVGYKSVSATYSDYNSCGLGTDNEIYCWGRGNEGQLGNAGIATYSTPVKVVQGARPAGVGFVSVSVGQYRACGSGTNKVMYCWGTVANMGLNSSSPVAINVAGYQSQPPTSIESGPFLVRY